jgi:predicted ATPase/DNA-binding SARP family transcriptional activator
LSVHTLPVAGCVLSPSKGGSAMEFRVLGPLEVVSGDAPIEVPGAKPRALLGLLLVHVNRVVSADRLVEELWEGLPPKSPGATLQTYVHRLRQALGLDSLRTRAGGYVLEVKDSDLDALRFERAVREVSQIENASPRWVATRLGEALAWWRGKALADFEAAAWARPETDRLEELRLAALEDLVEARLALGEHGVLVPELEMLVSQHPLRERLWEHLILALYRCDRQAEALRAYQRVRTTLAEQLGLEPGPELVGLERRIFDHDATLMAPLAEAGEGAPGRDREESGVGLPSPPTSFVGRSAELDEVTGLLDGHRLVTLTGAGGCGKTRLAIEVASRLADGFIDGVRFADLAAVTAGPQVGEAVVGALGLDHDPNRDPVARLAAYLGERAVLCVLDNCEHVVHACAALAEAVVTSGAASRLLATSRGPLGIVGEQVYVVPSLDVDTEAVCLFEDRGGEARAGFVVDDVNRETVTDICRRLDGIPLAIELAAARTAHLSPAKLLERLDDRFALLRAERRIPRHQTLTATLDWSYELLDVREREALRGLAVFPASFTLEAAEAVVGDDAVEVLGSLAAKSLVQVVDDDDEQLGYRLLETVRLYAQDRFAPDEADACRTRHRDWVVGWLADVPLAQRWWGDTDPSAPIHTDVRAALDWSAAQGDTEMVARLTAGTDIWRRRVQRREAIRWLEEAVAPGDAVPADLQVQLCVMISSLRSLTARGMADWTDIAHWSQRAIDAAGGRAGPLLPPALAFRAMAAAVTAVEARDESQVDRTTELVEACVAMGEQFFAPWRMSYRLHAGLACSTLATAWPRYAEVARRHFAAGVGVALPAPPYLGLHAELGAHLALHTFLVGDRGGACAIARETQASTARTRRFAPDIPLVLALLAAHTTPDTLLAELHRYHGRIQDNDNRPEAAEPVVLYGGFVAAMHEDWELASRLLAAGERSVYRNPSHAHLYLHFRRRIRDALGSERSRQLRDEGRAMPLADALAAALR